MTDISIHALLAESDADTLTDDVSTGGISIHALLAESDLINTYHRIFGEGISIHALLAESDGIKKFKMPVPAYFYPRSPCGERLEHLLII